jgi:hypothetical protein
MAAGRKLASAMARDCGPESRIMAMPPLAQRRGDGGDGVRRALSFLEEGTGFLVTFALEVMPEIGRRVGGQLRGQLVQPREDGPQVGLGLAGGHAAGACSNSSSVSRISCSVCVIIRFSNHHITRAKKTWQKES